MTAIAHDRLTRVAAVRLRTPALNDPRGGRPLAQALGVREVSSTLSRVTAETWESLQASA